MEEIIKKKKGRPKKIKQTEAIAIQEKKEEIVKQDSFNVIDFILNLIFGKK